MKTLVLTTILCLTGSVLNAQQVVDWTPFFKSWENGCELNKSQIELEENAIVYNRFKANYYLGRIVLPEPYKSSMRHVYIKHSHPTSTTSETLKFIFPISNGKYYGIPINYLSIYFGMESGSSGMKLAFDWSLSDISQVLSDVNYKSDESEYAGIESAPAKAQIYYDAEDNVVYLDCYRGM